MSPEAGGAAWPQAAELSASWARCATLHRLDPDSAAGPQVLSRAETARRRRPLERTIALAQEELLRLRSMAQSAGYATVLAEPGGAIVERQCPDAAAERLDQAGWRLGALWGEHSEGTNAVGTCLFEGRALSVHREQHFRARHADLSCCAAPLHDVHGVLKAVLAVVSRAADSAGHGNALALALVREAARSIEEREFRKAYQSCWIAALQPAGDDAAGVLLALNAECQLVGADRLAQAAFSLRGGPMDGLHVRQLFDCFPLICRKKGAEDVAISVTRAQDAVWSGVVTPPAEAFGKARDGAHRQWHTRPRLAILDLTRQSAAPPPGMGLSARVMRRLDEHVERNLDKSIYVEDLAAISGLSGAHFSRVFKSSTGLSPHRYVLQQRVSKAARLLLDTKQPLAEISRVAGFSDQSHFSRAFTLVVGVTPRSFRRSAA